tara:strand:- start:2080 stop:2994 length:915 start_codon:yes stop_codon:yes gene_type:complete
MSLYLGNFGKVMLQRKTAKGALEGTINIDDVNTTAKRFSFADADELLTGDQIEISSTNNANLAFIAASSWASNTQQSSFKAFVHKDEIGGLRMYSSFPNAINGGSSNAITLTSISSTIPIRISIANTNPRILGQVISYELNTDVESVDITALSDDKRERYSSLVSGNGSITCAWDYKDSVGSGEYDIPHYLLELVTRTKIGSEFGAQLYLKSAGYNPSGIANDLNHEIWYEITGVIVQTAVSFGVGSIQEMKINFITTGPLDIKMNVDTATTPSTYITEPDASDVSFDLVLDDDGSTNLVLEFD